MNGQIRWEKFDVMEQFMVDVFKKVGVPEERKDKGVPFNLNLQQTMIKLRDEMGLVQYKFSFEVKNERIPR